MNHLYQDALAILGIEGAHPGGFELTKQLLKNENRFYVNKSLMPDAGQGKPHLTWQKRFFAKYPRLIITLRW